MMTQNYVKITLFFLLAAVIAGCNGKAKKTEENAIAFDSIQVDKTYHLLMSDSNPNCNLQIKFIYPVSYKNGEVLSDIQRIFVTDYFGDDYGALSPQEAVDKYVTDYLAAYKDLEQDFKTDLERARTSDQQVGAWYSYYETSSNTVTYNKNDLISFFTTLENYTGGAHGAHAVNNHVINLKTGKPVTEQEIFVDEYQDTLAKMLVSKIAEQNKVKSPGDLENIGFFSADEIYPNGNFRVDDKGITYTFNEYEIAAYVVGQTNVFLPYEELQLILRKDSPVSQLFEA